jgi:hypothetical protein
MVHTGLRLSPKWIVHCGNIAMSGCQSCGCGDAVIEVVQRTSSETQTGAVMCVCLAMCGRRKILVRGRFQRCDYWQTPASYLPRDKFCCG